MTKLNQCISDMAINVNGLNSPIKRNRFEEQIKTHDSITCSTQEIHLTQEGICKMKIKGQKTILHVAGTQKKAGVAILFAGKVDLKPR